jgi:hypothetical protein
MCKISQTTKSYDAQSGKVYTKEFRSVAVANQSLTNPFLVGVQYAASWLNSMIRKDRPTHKRQARSAKFRRHEGSGFAHISMVKSGNIQATHPRRTICRSGVSRLRLGYILTLGPRCRRIRFFRVGEITKSGRISRILISGYMT